MENYEILRRIGTGFNAWVEMAMDKRTNEIVALKVFHNKNTTPLTTNNIFINEKQILQRLERVSGVIRLLNWSTTNSSSFSLSSQTLSTKFLVLQHHQNGDLLSYILQNQGPFKEDYALSLFLQIIEVIERIHQQGIVHRDIKLENILVDEEYHLHLADFGFATIGIDEKGRHKKLNDFLGNILIQKENILGSIAYAAPEMFLGDPYLGTQTDIFQLGVSLFILVFGCQPFQKAHPKDDWLYRLISRNQWSKYWEFHESQKKNPMYISGELKDLLQRMISVQPNQRLELKEIKAHPWQRNNQKNIFNRCTKSCPPFSCLKNDMVQRRINMENSMASQNKAKNFEECKK